MSPRRRSLWSAAESICSTAKRSSRENVRVGTVTTLGRGSANAFASLRVSPKVKSHSLPGDTKGGFLYPRFVSDRRAYPPSEASPRSGCPSRGVERIERMKTETDILSTLLPAPAQGQCRMSAFRLHVGSRKSVSPYFSRIQSYSVWAHFYADEQIN